MLLKKTKEEYAQLATQEMGKTIGQSRKELDKCALICNYYADNIKELLKDEHVKTEAIKSYVTNSIMAVNLIPSNKIFLK